MQYRYCPHCASPLMAKSFEPGTRLACSTPDCGFVYWNNPLPVVAALVEYQGQFVLARNVKWPRGIFSLVSGFLEQSENPIEAVRREVKEELNLDSQVTRFIGHYPFVEQNQILLAYALQASGELKTNAELAELKLLSLAQLQAYDFSPLYLTTAIVNDWLAQTAKP